MAVVGLEVRMPMSFNPLNGMDEMRFQNKVSQKNLSLAESIKTIYNIYI
jgi:hypothetical protein